MSAPETKYARSGDVHIAYQVIGNGPFDLVFVPGFVSHVELEWEDPVNARFLRQLASFSRLILFDKRGTGLSDRASTSHLFTLEQRMDDVRAVMDAVGSQRAALFGVSEGAPMSILFAATYPERTSALVLYGGFAKRSWSEDYPWAPTLDDWEAILKDVEDGWGGPVGLAQRAPSIAEDENARKGWASFLRQSASPGAVVALWRMNMEIDVRRVLPTIRVPTLVIHRTGDRTIAVDGARYMAQQIDGAKYVELPGIDHLFTVGDTDALLGEIEEFLTGVRPMPESDRVLATVMFADIVGSTEKAGELGDRKWHNLLDDYYSLMRRELSRFRGREIDTAGDGFFATFDGPARAVRFSCAIRDSVQRLGIQVRAGLHTGECELMGEKVGGLAVHIGARVMAKAGKNEVLVSSTVKDLVAGSGLEFEDRGLQALKGVEGEWHLYSVANC